MDRRQGEPARWRDRLLVWRIGRRLKRRLATDEAAAVRSMARALPRSLFGRELAFARVGIVWAMARQKVDGERRLADPRGAGGPGRAVAWAHMRGLGALQRGLAEGPAATAAGRIDGMLGRLIAAARQDPQDADGYGLATLHEMRRDIAAALAGRR